MKELSPQIKWHKSHASFLILMLIPDPHVVHENTPKELLNSFERIILILILLTLFRNNSMNTTKKRYLA